VIKSAPKHWWPERVAASGLGWFAVACSSGTTSGFPLVDAGASDAPSDVSSGSATDAPTFAADAPDLSGDAQTCTGAASIAITNFSSNGACYYDTSLKTGAVGTLVYVCTGGAATLTIGPEVFTGTYDPKGGTVSLQEQRNFPYSDGCTWTSVQTIDGDLTTGTFHYGYAEHVASGSGCASPCVASAQLSANVTPIPPPK
jgi:hypothetical protein